MTQRPERITGLYRLSVLSREPFEVSFGDTPLTDVRTLEVHHEAPMFIDQMVGLAGVEVEEREGVIDAMRLLPGRDDVLRFRITAEERVPELESFETHKVVAKLKTPVHYRGAWHHLKGRSEAALSKVSHRLTQPDSVGDHVASAIAMPFVALSAAMPSVAAGLCTTGLTGVACAVAVWAASQSLQVGVVAPAFCDPSRTYINGKLYKNLPEIRVQLRRGRIIGYATP